MLKIFTSYTPGAGKSYAMLEKAMAEQLTSLADL